MYLCGGFLAWHQPYMDEFGRIGVLNAVQHCHAEMRSSMGSHVT